MSSPSHAERPSRLLLISTAYSSGGAERCARDLFHRIGPRGFEPSLGVATRKPADPPAVTSLRFPFERPIARLARELHRPMPWRHLGSMIRLSRAARDFDLVHLHNIHAGYVSPAALSRLADKSPLIWTFHDEWPLTFSCAYDLSRVFSLAEIDRRFGPDNDLRPGTPRMRRAQNAYQNSTPIPAAIIAPSKYMASLAAAHPKYSAVPIHIIPYGLDLLDRPQLTLEKSAARKRFDLPADAPVILLIASLLFSPFKGMWLGAEAIRKLRKQFAKPVHVLMVGSESRDLANQIAQPLHYTGFLDSQADLAAAYRAADLTLIPSVADNFPYVATESLAAATPLVAFAVGGLVEILADGQHGLLADPFDTDQMARHLQRLLCDPDFAQSLGRAGAAFAREHWSMDRFIDAHAAAYQQTAARFASKGRP